MLVRIFLSYNLDPYFTNISIMWHKDICSLAIYLSCIVFVVHKCVVYFTVLSCSLQPQILVVRSSLEMKTLVQSVL